MGYAARRRAYRTSADFFQILSASPPWRLVMDTNVVLDLLHFLDPAAMRIRQAIDARRAQCYASFNTLAELSRVLSYPEFRLAPHAQMALLTQYHLWIDGVTNVTPTHPALPRCADPDDQMFLELAACVQADFLTSKDKALLALKRSVGGFKILTPEEAAVYCV